MGLWANDYELDTGLTFDAYQDEAMDTAIYPGQGEMLGLLYASLGLTNEAGEVAGKVKKLLRDRDEPLASIGEDEAHVIADELGDVLWYAAAVADEIGYTLGEIAEVNVLKLASRKARGKLKGSGDNR